ncbi:MAG: Fibronectin type III domain protein [candidate division BRC1 bacterium ADurb.BinA364]|nr:MAG: Fibronectin type III domain protein [candidate division BRC1 bacterium ADurb.BinA364]
MVDCFQLGNEPNFNMGGKVFASAADYVKRMQAFAHAIKAADPNAKIGLSLGWDNGQDLLAAAKAFPDKYWDIATHHSYKPHVSKPEDFAKARARADAGLDTLASRETIEARMASMPGGMPIMITEVGVWNKALDNAYGSLYLAEYVARMAANPEIRFIGIHQQWQMFMPANMYNKEVGEAGRLGRVLDLSPIDIPVTYPESAQALRIVNAAINDAIWTCDSRFSGGDAPEKLYARAFQGASGRDYLVVVNRSAQAYELTLSMDRSPLSQPMRQEFLWAPKADGPMAGDRQSLDTKNPVRIEPFSVNRIEWNSGIVRPPRATRIYKAEIAAGQAALRWWKRGEAAGYRIHYGEAPGAIGETIDAGRATEAVIGGLKENGRYFFRVIAYNQAGESSSSNEVDAVIAPPPSPDAPELAAGDGRIKAEWRSVPYAGGYRLYCRSEDGDTQCIDAGMMCGAVIRQLSNGKRYSFSVAAYNGAGESEESAAVSASPRAGIPFPPRSLKAVRSNGAVELSWSPSFASPAESYIVERSAMPTEGFAAIAEGVTGTGYLDKDAPREGDCYYRLIGVGGGMRSQYPSNAAAAMPAGAASRE